MLRRITPKPKPAELSNRSTRRRITAVALALLLLAAACSDGSDTNGANTVGANTDAADTGNAGSTSTGAPVTSTTQSLGVSQSTLAELERCGDGGGLCGEVLASDGYPVRFRLIPAASSQPTAGLVAMHFGGPGTNAREFISRFAPEEPEQDMLGRFDLLGVEQRGTDAVEGVDCGNDALFHQLNIGVVAVEDQARLAQEWISGCPVGSFGTATAAEDIATVLRYLDAGRTVFVGYSYGGVVGVLLGSDHTDVVDAIVLDSPGLGWVDPRRFLVLVAGFGEALEGFFTNCDQTGGCMFAPDGNAEARFRAIHDSYELPGDLLFATVNFLYDERSAQQLDFIFYSALQGDYSQITWAADSYHSRQGETYPPAGEVFALVACSDGLADYTGGYEQFLAEIRTYGALGELAAKGLYDSTGICDHWPGESEAFELDLSNSNLPVLMVGATGDPAAHWSYIESFAETSLPPQSAVVAVHGVAHSIWRSGNECVDDAVNAFILDSTLPTIPASEKYLECDPLGAVSGR